MKTNKLSFIPTLAALLAAGTYANAATILINNHSFEAPNVTGNTLGGTPTGWSSTDVGIVVNNPGNGIAYTIFEGHTNVTPPPATGDDLSGDADDDQMAMLRNDVILHQTLSTMIAANTTYTLSVDAALRNNGATVPLGSAIRLGTGSTAGTNLLTPTSSSFAALSDTTWTTWQATFTTGDTVPDAALRIEIYWPTITTDNDTQGLFDNARLTANAIPEPGTAALGGLGFLILLRRRR